MNPPEKDAQDKLVTVYTLNDPVEAELLRNLLIDHDIRCEIDGEHQAGFTGTFEIGLLVFESDAAEAATLIHGHHSS